MKPVLKGLMSPELPSGPGEVPDDPGDCCILMWVDLGTEGDEAADQLDFYVCTRSRRNDPAWVTLPEWDNRRLYVDRFSWQIVEEKVRELCDTISGETWNEVTMKLAPYLHWEFEEYREREAL